MPPEEILSQLFYFILGFLAHIFTILAFLISIIHRSIVHLILINFYKSKYQIIKAGVSAVMAEKAKESVNALYVLKCKGDPNLDKIVEKLYQVVKYETKTVSGGESQNPYRPFEKLCNVVVPKFWVYCWKLDHVFRAENHVVLENVSQDLDIAVQERCEKLLDTVYRDHQPQWELHILFQEDIKEYTLVWSVHHTYADGTIFTQLIRYALADSPFPIKIDPLEWDRKQETPFRRIWNYIEPLVLCTFGSVGFARIFGQNFGQTRIKKNVLAKLRGGMHCRTLTLDLNTLKTIQKKGSREQPIRLVSLLYACVTPAIDRALSPSKNVKPTTVLASTVEGFYPYQTLELENEMAMLWFDLPLNIYPREERLRVINQNVRRITGYLGMSFFKLAYVLVGAVISPITRLLEISGILTQTTRFSNVVGPEKAFTIFGGDRVTSMYAYSPIILQEAVTFVSYTYDGELTLAMVAQDRVVKKLPRFLDDIVEGVKDEVKKYNEISWVN